MKTASDANELKNVELSASGNRGLRVGMENMLAVKLCRVYSSKGTRAA